MSGVERDLTEVRSPENSADQEICGVLDGEKYGPLGVMWDLKNGHESLTSGLGQVAADHPQRLPTRLGAGFAAYSPRTSHLPYESGSLFRCGPHLPWIYLALRRVAPGRDAVADLTGLMRIAQRRFGKLHHCVPGPMAGS